MIEEENINHGVLLGQRDTDFVAGTLPYKELNPSGNWTGFVPPGEWQGSSHADSMACVTFSALNCIETQERFLTGNQWNYSDRWIAKMSGTTPEGNYLYKVADTIRKYGLVLEEDYPAPKDFTWNEYYADIPKKKLDELLAKGQDWLKTHDVAYEFLTPDDWNLDYHLKHAPIQVVIPGHAIEGIYSPGDVMNYFDSYSPYNKQTKVKYLQSAMKLVLTIKPMAKKYIIEDQTTSPYRIGVMIVEGEAATAQFAPTMEDLQKLCEVAKIDPATAKRVIISGN